MDHLCSPHSDPTKREEHLRPYLLSALGHNEHLGVSDSDEASGEKSHSQTEADELRDALKAETDMHPTGIIWKLIAWNIQI